MILLKSIVQIYSTLKAYEKRKILNTYFFLLHLNKNLCTIFV